MLAQGITTCDIHINDFMFLNSFIVCMRQNRPIILGRDFTIPNAISVGWTKKVVMECQENFKGKTLALSRPICIPPHCIAVAEVVCATDMKGKFQVQPNPIFLRDNPNVYCKLLVYDMTPVDGQTKQSPSSDLQKTTSGSAADKD